MLLISSKRFLKHKKKGHVECPDRIAGILKKYKYEEAKDGEAYLNIVHTTQYIDFVKKHTGILDSGETYADDDTYKVAKYAVGAAVQAADSALKGVNAFALVRPPGHHAHPDFAGGFCIFSNMAIAAGYAAGKGKRVLIIDIDMHRGDGTQACVKRLNKDLGGRLWYLSINQRAVFPGASIDEGNITNVYVDEGTQEKDYIALMEKEVLEHIKKHRPDIIGISAGFDTFVKDREIFGQRLGCGLSNTSEVVNRLKKLIKVPYFIVLEGGYCPKVVEEGVDAFLKDAHKVKVSKDNEIKLKTKSNTAKTRNTKKNGKEKKSSVKTKKEKAPKKKRSRK